MGAIGSFVQPLCVVTQSKGVAVDLVEDGRMIYTKLTNSVYIGVEVSELIRTVLYPIVG